MPCPICTECGRELPDWEGNIMVDSGYRTNRRIDWIKVICKPCTRDLNRRGLDRQYHNLMELSWLSNHRQLYYFGIEGILDDLTSASPSRLLWTREAIGQLLRLIALSLNVDLDEEHHQKLWG